jgi:dTMP kinase
MDLGWSTNPVESFRLFQGKVLQEYDSLVDEFSLQVVDAAGSITEQQRLVRQLIAQHVRAGNVEITDDEPVSA